MIKNAKDIVAIRLLSCIKAMVETLPLVTQKKEIKEFELCTRYLQSAFQKLFDCDDNELVFKWLNVNCFDDSQKRPDGIVENDEKAVGYFEVKPIKYAKDHKKINMDFYRLCVFSKIGTAKYKTKNMFQVMAVGTNVQFHLSQIKDNVLIVTELDNVRLPLSLDELPQMIPYLDRLCNAMDVTSRCTYEINTADVPSKFGICQEPKVIKAITEKTIDRTRINAFYHPYH